ncbi:MAG: hypothetical protein ACKV2U_29045 [Bryobacteraceae bacterium]
MRPRAMWLFPAIHILVSAISGYFYVRHLFALARTFAFGQTAPEPPLAQMLFWLFNLPCLMLVTLLSGIAPLSWQPQEYTRAWLVQPATLLACAVLNTGVWVWLGAQWEDPGDRVPWWRWGLGLLGVCLAAGILLHTRSWDWQVLPFAVWPLLLAAWATRPAFTGHPSAKNVGF